MSHCNRFQEIKLLVNIVIVGQLLLIELPDGWAHAACQGHISGKANKWQSWTLQIDKANARIKREPVRTAQFSAACFLPTRPVG